MRNRDHTIDVSNLSRGQNRILIHTTGDHDSNTFNLGGCGGGWVAVTVLGQQIVPNWNESARGVEVSINFYEDLDKFNSMAWR